MASPTPVSDASEPVDRARLARMRDEVGEATTRRFIATYLELLGSRLERIAKPEELSRADGVRAAFDLRVSSEMLGAARLADVAAGFERSLREGKVPGSRRMTLLRREAAAVAGSLSGLLKAVCENGGR